MPTFTPRSKPDGSGGRPVLTALRSDEEANRIVVENIGLLYWNASHPQWRRQLEHDDRISIAGEAMVLASRLWNPKVSRFSTFAEVCVTSAMLNEILRRKRQPRPCNLSDTVLAVTRAKKVIPDTSADLLFLRSLVDGVAMSEMQRAAIDGHLAGRSATEMAAELQCTVQNVCGLLGRAKAAIAEAVEQSAFRDLLPAKWRSA